MNGTEIVFIAAVGRNRELGIGPELIWKTKGDLKRFKDLTWGHPIIMGRKTYESIGRPLPGRANIIVTRDPDYRVENAVVVHSVEEAIAAAKGLGDEVIAVIGGGEIYKAALPYATKLEMTLVDAEEPRATAFFPEYEHEFKEIERSEAQEEDGVTYQWVTFERK